MIVFKFSKLGSAEFISHLDTLRHLNKTFIRGGIPVKKSMGFHPHALVFMSSPIGGGLKSLAEYCAVDTDVGPEEFMRAFNAASPKGIKCAAAFYSEKNPNLASAIVAAKYYIEGLGRFDPEEIMRAEEFFAVNKKGERVNVRGKIFSVSVRGEGIEAVLAAGNASLRPDIFIAALKAVYGGGYVSCIKEESYLEGLVNVDDALAKGENL
ncbi:MAG: DUF2344 domain-containing protein [Clostridia bacterium]|nr:DUF2344 domain-containing protein [Clostridia bacterium]